MSEVKKTGWNPIWEARNGQLAERLLALLSDSAQYDVEQLGPRVQEVCGGAIDFSEIGDPIEMITIVRAAIFEATGGEQGSREAYRLVDEENPIGIFSEIRTLIREGNETEVDSGIRRLEAFASLVDAQAAASSADHVVEQAIRTFVEEELEGWRVDASIGVLRGPGSDKKTERQFLRLLLFARSRGYETIRIEKLVFRNNLLPVPAGLEQLEELKSVSSSSPELSSRDLDYIACIPALEELSLYKIGLSTLPPQLAEMPKLKSLKLWGNPLGGASFELLAQCSALEELNLTHCGLTELPPQLAKLPNLRFLNLGYNPFGGASVELLAQCSALEELDLTHCGLTDLPSQLGELSALRSLILPHNSFEEASFDVLAQLSALRTLLLNDCRLQGVPAVFGELTQLEELFLSFNPFDNADSLGVLGAMTGLTHLNVGQCGLRELPVDFSSLVHLETLWLAENELLDLPDTLFDLDGLKNLHVHDNCLPDSLVSRLAGFDEANPDLRVVRNGQKPIFMVKIRRLWESFKKWLRS